MLRLAAYRGERRECLCGRRARGGYLREGGKVTERRTIGELLEAARGRLDRLTPAAAWAEAQAGSIIVDTRSEDARRREGTIPGAIAIPLSVLYWRADPTSGFEDPRIADPDRRLIILCAHGFSSSLAAATLRDLGFHRATDVDGGFEAWAEDGLPVEA
jgi:rhodanese-related sulfurtransferase